MTARTAVTDPPFTAPPATRGDRRGRFAENSVIGMALFVFAEVMFFSGFISGFIITQRSALPGSWPPFDQPRLPAASTAFNTVALLASGVLLFFASRAYRRGALQPAQRWMAGSILLGALFVGLQGVEWARMLAQGLTLTSSPIGSYFYVIVGAHALHAVVALAYMAAVWFWLRTGRLTRSRFGAVQLFWYFVVLMWPLIYWKVYL